MRWSWRCFIKYIFRTVVVFEALLYQLFILYIVGQLFMTRCQYSEKSVANILQSCCLKLIHLFQTTLEHAEHWQILFVFVFKNVFILQTSDHEIWPWDVYLIKSFSFLFNVNFNEMNCTEDILTIWAFKKGKRYTPPKDSIPAIFADVYTFVKRGVTH